MNIWNSVRLFFSSLFQGLASADDIIQGQATDDGSKTIGVHQVKDVHRVAPALLRGEVTKEVAELRYRDYLVSERARMSDNDKDDMSWEDYIKSFNVKTNYKFSAMNHVICSSITDSSSIHTQPSYTLNFKYSDSVKFCLEKYCESFAVDGCTVVLRFNMKPNRNVVTSKAFCNYLSKRIFGNLNVERNEYSIIPEMGFTTYKISSVPNYLKFVFKNLKLTNIEINENKSEFLLTYVADWYTVENLIEKYRVDELEEKYSLKEKKNLPYETEILDTEGYVCEICKTPMINESEGKFNKSICGKFCCTNCCCKELMKQENQKES